MSSWQNLEVLLVDNESRKPATRHVVASLVEDPRVQVMTWNRPFNYSAANNAAVRTAAGDFLIFLSGATHVLTDNWIEELVGYAFQPRLGAVGAKLVSPDGRLQHAGIVLGLNGLAGNLFSGVHEVTLSPEHTHVARECLAVSGACLAIERAKFELIGGFNEEFEITGSDLELGLRLHSAGYRNVWNPEVQLVHVEKATRGIGSIRTRHVHQSEHRYEPFLGSDPFYNAQLSLRRPRRVPLTKKEAIARTRDRSVENAPGQRDQDSV
jgi:GT2 family glycosyltransferase